MSPNTPVSEPTPNPRIALRRPHRMGVLSTALVVGSLGVIVLPAPHSSTVMAAPADAPESVLAVGAEGDEVRRVQESLSAAGVEVPGGADGRFGPMTQRAVREFQLTRGLMATGTVDAATRSALMPTDGSVTASVLGLSQGATGGAVRALQQALVDVGMSPGSVDGIFGPLTAAALVAYQQGRDLPTSGVLDAETARHLAALARPAATTEGAAAPEAPEMAGLTVGARGAAVRTLQERLLATGLTFLGGADGIFGPATANALRLFQSNRGLAVTGAVDAETAAALGGVAPAPAPDRVHLEGLAPGSRGSLVTELQNKLLAAGITVPGGADGIFGPATANSLKQFQAARSLESSGRVDAGTARALAEVTTASPAPSPAPAPAAGFPAFGEQGQRVRSLQQALIAAGITVPGGADGIFGTMTAGAVMSFQRERSLEPTGTVTAETAAALGLGASEPAPPPPPAPSVELAAFPVQGQCSFADTWHAPRGGGRLHEGTDIIAAEGQFIYAVAAGTITQTYQDRPGSRAGNGVRLTLADGTYFFYAHLQSLAEGIEKGATVAAGQILGYNGSTGNAGVPHLHFEIHPGGGAAVNPYAALRAVNGCSTSEVPPQP